MKVGIVGCAGRMGRMLVAEVMASDGVTLIGGTEHSESAFLEQDIAKLAGFDETGIVVGSDTDALFSVADVVIDSENSIVIKQANNRTYSAQIVLKKILENIK